LQTKVVVSAVLLFGLKIWNRISRTDVSFVGVPRYQSFQASKFNFGYIAEQNKRIRSHSSKNSKEIVENQLKYCIATQTGGQLSFAIPTQNLERNKLEGR